MVSVTEYLSSYMILANGSVTSKVDRVQQYLLFSALMIFGYRCILCHTVVLSLEGDDINLMESFATKSFKFTHIFATFGCDYCRHIAKRSG